MLAFEVHVNGRKLCVAGCESVLSAGVTWAGHDPDQVQLHVGGLNTGDESPHASWETPSLSIGDSITIRIVDVPSHDPPDHFYPAPARPENQ